MESSHNNHDIVIDRLIDFFYKLSGNRAMPNLFPNVFSEEVLEKYGNKSKQLSYLFTIYKQKEEIEDLSNILIGNLSWTEDLEEKLNDIIEPLDLISLNGEVSKKSELVEQLTFGSFQKARKEISETPKKKEEILAQYNISQTAYEDFENTINSFAKAMKPLLSTFSSFKTLFEPSRILAKLASFELPSFTLSPPILYPLLEGEESIEEVLISGLCPLTNGTCSLPDVIIKDLEEKKPYAFLIFPSEYKALEEITNKILSKHSINLITAIAEPFFGGKYCKICSFIKFSNFCIAEIGGLNPNVLMEVGLAFGLDRITILTLNEKHTIQGDVPFDLNSFMNIPYKTNEELEKELENHVQKIKKHIELHRN